MNKIIKALSIVLVLLLIIMSLLILKDKGIIFKEKIDVEDTIKTAKLKIIDEQSDSRVIAVMINNNHSAWPHAGLNDAFLNYEIIVEGGVTRIMSLFKDANTSKIGSVRSARHYFLDYAMEYDAIYVHHGFSPYAKNDISKYKIDNIDGMYDGSGFWRDTTLDKAYEHTSFTNIEKINTVIDKKAYRKTSEEKLSDNYSVDEINVCNLEGAIPADKIKIEYSSYHETSYEYNEETKTYLRSMSNTLHKDAITEGVYETKNIITYQVKNYTLDNDGRQELENIGEGEGYFITNGCAVPITWEKTSRESKTVYKYKNGEKLKLNDGVTWIQIQPQNKKLVIESKENVYNEIED